MRSEKVVTDRSKCECPLDVGSSMPGRVQGRTCGVLGRVCAMVFGTDWRKDGVRYAWFLEFS